MWRDTRNGPAWIPRKVNDHCSACQKRFHRLWKYAGFPCAGPHHVKEFRAARRKVFGRFIHRSAGVEVITTPYGACCNWAAKSMVLLDYLRETKPTLLRCVVCGDDLKWLCQEYYTSMWRDAFGDRETEETADVRAPCKKCASILTNGASSMLRRKFPECEHWDVSAALRSQHANAEDMQRLVRMLLVAMLAKVTMDKAKDLSG